MRLPGVLCSCVLVFIGPLQVCGQAVVATHSGLLNYLEGIVLVDDQPVIPKPGIFANLKEGSILRTERGRAEVLLTPGVFLRIDEKSAVRMISSALSATRVEVLQGAVILDSNEASPGSSIVLVYKKFELRFPKQGVYRIDSEPGVLEAYTGEAEVREAGGSPKKIDEFHEFFFGIGMETKKYGEGAVDAFSEWARTRAETIQADNRAANQSSDPPPDPVSSPFFTVEPAPAPLYVSPAVPSFAGAGVIDGGFYGLNSPFYNQLFPGNPFILIYLYPHWPKQNSEYGTQPRRNGSYPVLPPSHAGVEFHRATTWRPTPMPLRQSFTGVAGSRMNPVVPVRAPVFPRAAFPARPMHVASPTPVTPPRTGTVVRR